MNVGILLPGFSANKDDWAIPVQQNLIREMSTHANVRVITTRYPHMRTPYTIYNATVYPLGAGAWARKWARLRLWWDTLHLLQHLHNEQAFDVLHAMWADETGLLATWAGKQLNIPVVVSIAGGELVGFDDIDYGLQRSRFSRWTVRQAIEGASAIVIACEYIRELLRQHHYIRSPEKSHKIVLGVDTTAFTPAPERQKPRHLIHVASLIGVKDQTTLLRALAQLDNATLTIVGEGRDHGLLVSLTHQLKIAHRVTFAGKVHHLDLSSYYQQAQINLLTSRHEGLGMVTLEAGACGIPTISTTVGLLPDEPALGHTIPIGDSQALAMAIKNMLNDEKYRHDLAQSAHERVVSSFTIEHTVEAFLSLYQSLIRP